MGPRAIGDHGTPVSLPKLKKAYEKGTRGISWGPLLTPGPRAVPEFPNGQSAPAVSHNLLPFGCPELSVLLSPVPQCFYSFYLVNWCPKLNCICDTPDEVLLLNDL
ncbi:unnamed protein product [Staurois parvus]|uniref:Uncharacterized protein n=1 Tax=Staurois parvus TaxID=386267 RepID=A0ABN9DGL2_9NEOB|nr:unnamed protein product [Staurois parvus]